MRLDVVSLLVASIAVASPAPDARGVITIPIARQTPSHTDFERRSVQTQQFPTSGYPFLANFSIGTPPQQVPLQIDFRFAELLVMSDAGCAATNKSTGTCYSTPIFSPNKSSSYQATNKTFAQTALWEIPGAAAAAGTAATDKVEIGGKSINMRIDVVQKDGANPPNRDQQNGMAGTFGLGFMSGMWTGLRNPPEVAPWITVASQWDKSEFGLQLSRNGSAYTPSENGYLTFGGLPLAVAKGKPAIVYNDLAMGVNHWALALQNITLNGKPVPDLFHNNQSKSEPVMFIRPDSSVVELPAITIPSFFKMIPGATKNKDGTYKVPCDANATLSFSFGGNDYSLFQSDWIRKVGDNNCVANIVAQPTPPGNEYKLGLPFLVNYYSSFQIVPSPQIAFIKVPGHTNTLSNGTSTSGDGVSRAVPALVNVGAVVAAAWWIVA